jgi:uncharacterized protein YkwD
MKARWLRLATVCSISVGLIAVLASPAPAAAHPRHHHRRYRPHHHAARPRPGHHAAPSQAQTSPSQAPASPPCPNADTPAVGAPADLMRAAILCLINQERDARGLPGLRDSPQLNGSAQGWSQTMVATGNFDHGANFPARVSSAGYNWQLAGENIATGYPTPRSVVDAWMRSQDHCRNILDPSFRDLGIGVTGAAIKSLDTGASTWTADLGLLMSQSAPSRDSGPQNGCPY